MLLLCIYLSARDYSRFYSYISLSLKKKKKELKSKEIKIFAPMHMGGIGKGKET
jgi:hypothetical protein